MSYEQAANAAIKTSYAASGGAVVAGLTWNEIAAIVGIIMAVATYITSSWISWHFKKKHFDLTQKLAKDSKILMIEKAP